MARKYNTIIFVPHARAKFRKLTISSRVPVERCRASPRLLLLVTAVTFTTVLLRVGPERPPVPQDGRRERAPEVERRQDDRTGCSMLSKKLDDFEERTRRLAIVAGIADSVSGGVGRSRRSAPGRGSASFDLGATRKVLSATGSRSSKPSSRAERPSRVDAVGRPVRGLVTCGLRRAHGPVHRGTPRSTRASTSPPRAATRSWRPPDGTVVMAGWAERLRSRRRDRAQ